MQNRNLQSFLCCAPCNKATTEYLPLSVDLNMIFNQRCELAFNFLIPFLQITYFTTPFFGSIGCHFAAINGEKAPAQKTLLITDPQYISQSRQQKTH
jgi:hypothetical protein